MFIIFNSSVVAVGSGIMAPVYVDPEDFSPRVFLNPNSRILYDDCTEPGAISGCGQELVERINNYAFEGEQIKWDVLVWDKNGNEKVKDVYVAIHSFDGARNETTQGSVTYCGSVPNMRTSWTENITLPKFNPAMGTLLSASVYTFAEMSSQAQLENLDAQAAGYTVVTNGTIQVEDGEVSMLVELDFVRNTNLAAFDGGADFLGPSAIIFPDLTNNDSQTQAISNLTAYTGAAENFDLMVTTDSFSSVIGPANNLRLITTNASAQACVTYEYENTILIPGEDEVLVEANCQIDTIGPRNLRELEGLIYEGEEVIEWNEYTMRWHTCLFTVEPAENMHGEYFIGAYAEDLGGQIGQFFEQELWFFNPEIALGLDGTIDFGIVRPGGVFKSSTVALTNAAEAGSGVLLDMYIAGTDFYDPFHRGTMCPTSNVLLLNGPDGVLGNADDAFRYYASQGAYNTCDNNYADDECYDAINHYMDGAGSPVFNNYGRIIESLTLLGGEYPAGNILSPGADMSLNFKLRLPEPCIGGPFTQGKILFFGEAI